LAKAVGKRASVAARSLSKFLKRISATNEHECSRIAASDGKRMNHQDQEKDSCSFVAEILFPEV